MPIDDFEFSVVEFCKVDNAQRAAFENGRDNRVSARLFINELSLIRRTDIEKPVHRSNFSSCGVFLEPFDEFSDGERVSVGFCEGGDFHVHSSGFLSLFYVGFYLLSDFGVRTENAFVNNIPIETRSSL